MLFFFEFSEIFLRILKLFSKIQKFKMTSSLTVIGLVIRLKISNYISYGDAVYRDRSTDEINTFTIKQFANAQNECNQNFKEGDLVLFGGKFTLEQQKLLVSIILLPV